MSFFFLALAIINTIICTVKAVDFNDTFPVLSRDVFIESPTTLSDKYVVIANNLHIPDDLPNNFLFTLRQDRKPVFIFAVHLQIKSNLNLVGVPHLSLYSHTLAIPSSVTVDISAPEQTGSPGFPASPSGESAGNITIFSAKIHTDNSTTHTFKLIGSEGVDGKDGQPGEKGADGTAGQEGQCRKANNLCVFTRGNRGTFPGRGGSGGPGSNGGDGGDGGHFRLLSSTSIPISVENSGGDGGRRGEGGPGGPSGDRQPFDFIDQCNPVRQNNGGSCGGVSVNCGSTIVACNAVRVSGIQPSGGTGPEGADGTAGSDGSIGNTQESFSNKHNAFPDPSNIVSSEDILRITFVLYRYYVDLVLSRSSRLEAIAVMESVISLGDIQTNDPIVQNLASQARIMRSRALLNADVFTRGRLSRNVPATLQNRLNSALDLAESVSNLIADIQISNELKELVLSTANVSIPATDIAALQQKFQERRDVLKEAVLRIDEEISSAMIEVNDNIRRLQEEQEQAVRLDFVSAIFGALTDGLGFAFEAISGGGNGLELLENPFSFLGPAFEIGQEFIQAEERGCELDTLLEFLVPAAEREGRFPNTVDLDSDFSEITDIGTVATLSKAFISARSVQAVAQLECLYDVDLASFGQTKALMENLFNFMGSRVDILNDMMSIDLELNELQIIAEGIEKQKEALSELGQSTPSKERALLEMSITFEQARIHALRILQQQADGFGFIALRSLDVEVQQALHARLHSNGQFGFDNVAPQMIKLRSLRLAVEARYDSVRFCFSSSQGPEHYFWDLTRENHPLLFQNGGLTTGENRRSLFELNINRDCSSSRSATPHVLGLPITTSQSLFCSPNEDRYYSRVSGFAVEFVGANATLAPPSLNTLTVSLRQVGAQTFRRTENKIVAFEVEPLVITVPLVSTVDPAADDIEVQYTSPCGVDVLSLRDGVLGSGDKICPSPYTSYELQIEENEIPSVQAFLNSVQAVRVHARITSFAVSNVVEACEPPVIVGPIRKKGNLTSSGNSTDASD